MSIVADFHPLIRDWLSTAFRAPTAVQKAAWRTIPKGGHTLIAAPTGTGKTLAGWLPLIDRMIGSPAVERGVRVVYLSPLRALSRDMVSQLTRPLAALEAAPGDVRVPAVGLRTSDTPAGERRAQQRRPPEMLVTTPESLFVLLCSAGGRRMLRTVEAVIVDEIHALADTKRGAHLALSLEFLDHIRGGPPAQRIGLSATQRPLVRMGRFLAGTGQLCTLLEPMPDRVPELCVELPERPLGAFADATHQAQIHQRLADVAATRRSMLVFCNTRALVERTARALAELLGEDQVAAHHGSLGQARRGEVESGLREGRLRVVVSSASLELGLDLGRVEEVCLLGSPGRINVLRQRAGRACHRPDTVPRARLFPLTLSDLLEAQALCDALAAGEMDASRIVAAADDVLCQQLTAMVAAGIDRLDTLYSVVRRAWPWRGLQRSDFDRVVGMLADGFVPGRETGRGLLTRAGGRLIATPGSARRVRMNAGTIPVWFDYPVVREPDRQVLGSLDEEYAFESSPGQIMQLGNQALRILRVSPAAVSVEPAPGETPDVPFWFGDAPGRSDELSRRVQDAVRRVGRREAVAGDEQLRSFLRDSARVLGRLPGPEEIVLERFFDPGGDQHVVLHTLRGARINRAWGLALRKRFCRQFNFELQAAATDNAVLVSLGATHSFDLAALIGYLNTVTVRQVLTQAVLDTPLYLTRFRWCATTALAIQRVGPRGRVPAQLQRNQTENLVARVFPDQLACLENLSGERKVPDHPLVTQALRDCLETHMDIAGLESLLAAMDAGRVRVHCVETTEPSPLARAVINAPRHSFLDPAAAEERRTRAFESQPSAPGVAHAQSRAVDHQVRQLRNRAWISTGDSHAFEVALIRAGYLTAHEGESGVSASGARAAGSWVLPFRHLVRQGLAGRVRIDPRRCLWAAADRLPEIRAIWPEAAIHPASIGRGASATPVCPEEALPRLLLARIRVLGPVPAAWLARETGLPEAHIAQALAALRAEGILMCSERAGDILWWSRECRLVAA